MTRKMVLFLVSAAWFLSFIVCFPPMATNLPNGFKRPMNDCTCTPLHNSTLYIIYSAICSFHLPFVIIIYLYVRIYRKVRFATRASGFGFVSAVHMIKPALTGGIGNLPLVATPSLNTSPLSTPRGSHRDSRVSKVSVNFQFRMLSLIFD